MPVTLDHADILEHAARHALSPALAGDAPVLAAQGEPGERCGWEAFFSALDARDERLDLASDGGSRTVPRAAAPSPSPGPASLRAFLRQAGATARAWRRGPTSAPPPPSAPGR